MFRKKDKDKGKGKDKDKDKDKKHNTNIVITNTLQNTKPTSYSVGFTQDAIGAKEKKPENLEIKQPKEGQKPGIKELIEHDKKEDQEERRKFTRRDSFIKPNNYQKKRSSINSKCCRKAGSKKEDSGPASFRKGS